MKPSCEAGSNRVGKDFKQLYEEKSKELRVTTENLKNYENIMIDVEKCVKDCRQGGQEEQRACQAAKVEQEAEKDGGG